MTARARPAQMRHDDYGHALWKAEEMAGFVADRTGFKVDKIDRPSFFRSAFFPPAALAALAAGAWAAWLLYQAPFMRQLWIYALGSLFVFWFSVSGGMHNIIRGVPLYYFNQQGQARRGARPGCRLAEPWTM